VAQKFKTGVVVEELASASSQAVGVKVDGDSQARIQIDAGGKITWGSGSATGDATLYRSAANALKTDDTLQAAAGVITVTTDGAPSAALADGAIAIDTTNDAFYFRSSSTWSQVSGGGGASLSVSDGPPSSPSAGDLWFESDTGRTLVYYADGSSNQWVEIGTASDSGVSGADGKIQFSESESFTSDTLLHWDNTNNRLGVGTASPGYPLDVSGTSRFTGAITASGGVVGNVTGNASGTALTVTQPAQTAITSVGTLTGLQITSATQYAGLRVSDANTTIGEIVGFAADNDTGGLKLYNAGTANVQLLSSGDSYLIGGKVGIGDSSPDAQLDVYHNADNEWVAIFDQDHATGYGVKITGDMTATNDALLKIEQGSTQVFRQTQKGLHLGTSTEALAKLHIVGGAFAANITVGGNDIQSAQVIGSASMRGGVLNYNLNDYRNTNNNASFMHCDPYDAALTTDAYAFRAMAGASLVDTFWVSGTGDAYFKGSIHLGGTGSANAMDDYEEGTWTPAWQTTNSDIGSATYAFAYGWYTKIGRTVHASCNLRTTALASVGTGDVILTGLPFTSYQGDAGVYTRAVGSCEAPFSWGSDTPDMVHVANNTTTVTMMIQGSGASNDAGMNATSALYGGSGNRNGLIMTVTYTTA